MARRRCHHSSESTYACSCPRDGNRPGTSSASLYPCWELHPFQSLVGARCPRTCPCTRDNSYERMKQQLMNRAMPSLFWRLNQFDIGLAALEQIKTRSFSLYQKKNTCLNNRNTKANNNSKGNSSFQGEKQRRQQNKPKIYKYFNQSK